MDHNTRKEEEESQDRERHGVGSQRIVPDLKKTHRTSLVKVAEHYEH
jgi:hypothetical protein